MLIYYCTCLKDRFSYILDCSQILDANPRSTNNVYKIYPDGRNGVSAYCDMSDGGWTVSHI